MANPQPDKHTRISNELLEHLIRTPLSGNQWQVLMCIVRKTYGFHKKQDYLTNSQIIEATGLGKTVVSRCLTLLQKGNFIVRNGHITGLQKDYELWQHELTKQITKVSKLDNSKIDKKLAKQEHELTKQITKVSYSLDTQKKKETIQKKSSISFEEYKETLRDQYPELDFDNEFKKWHLYWFEGNKKCKNPKLALHNWMDKAREYKKELQRKRDIENGVFTGKKARYVN